MKFFSSRNIIIISLFSFILFTIPSFSQGIPSVESPPTGIILLIGDGMGFDHIELGRLVEYGPSGESALLNFTYQNSISTVNIDGITTDSAASATAIATGIKTRNGRIATSYDASVDYTTILEIAQDNGYATGIVATCYLTHATPAAFMAHNPSRNDNTAIVEDISHANVDVLLGGGSNNYYLGDYISEMQSDGYEYITDNSELNSTSTVPLLGLFSSTSLTPAYQKLETSSQPSLLNMTMKAIDLLNNTGDPFFLMVEGSQIDWGAHDNDPIYTALEVIEFEKSVKYVKELAEIDSNLQVLVTADHETGGLSVGGYTFTTALPSDTDDFETKRSKRIARADEVATSWSTGGHTSSEVILAGMGPNTEKILNATHHVDTFPIMREIIDGQTEPSILDPYSRYMNLFVLIFLGSLLGVAVLTALFTWIGKKKKRI